ncbi:hypothetical protein ACVOMV_00965 [Mesorhizobium atlanticum]
MRSGRLVYLQRLVALKDWARPLPSAGGPPRQLCVLEAVSPADAIPPQLCRAQ